MPVKHPRIRSPGIQIPGRRFAGCVVAGYQIEDFHMDLSKLPKMSQTPPPADSSTPTPLVVGPIQSPPPLAPAMGEAWLSIAIGVILLLVFPRFLQWLSSRL